MGERFWSWYLANKVRAHVASVLIVMLVVLVGGLGFWSWLWETYKTNREPIVSIVTLVGGAIAAWVALGQLKTARERHEEQVKTDQKRDDADRQRRITESFTKAVEQLGSDKIQVRLGGIYTLERVSRESASDYWPIMETLTAFVRERVRWKNEDNTSSQVAAQPSGHRLPTDIEAVLTVIKRRDAQNREREKSEEWYLDLSSTDLRGAIFVDAQLERIVLRDAHLEGASFHRAHLEEASFTNAHLQEAYFWDAHLEGAYLEQAHLEKAYVMGAHLQGAILNWIYLKGAHLMQAHLEEATLFQGHLEEADFRDAHLEGANLIDAHLEGANLCGAYLNEARLMDARLEGANLQDAKGLVQDQLNEAFGNAETKLPEGLIRPAHWPQ